MPAPAPGDPRDRAALGAGALVKPKYGSASLRGVARFSAFPRHCALPLCRCCSLASPAQVRYNEAVCRRSLMPRTQSAAKVIPSDPAWERMKATRRTVNHHDAVRESAFLTAQWYRMWGRGMIQVDVCRLIQTLSAKKI